MDPSSLIFLVIIGIWAAYFVQYWVRRREHLATIRSVDAFSETMRVLERRAPLPSVHDGGRAPRTYAVSPARVMRPEVTVKRAEAHTTMTLDSDEAASAPRLAGQRGGVRPGDAVVAAGERRAPMEAAADDVPYAAMHPSRATRGIVLLVGALGTVVFGALAAFGVLRWWSFVVPLAMAIGGFVWLRAGVQGEIRAKRAARGRARRARERAAAPRSAARHTSPTRSDATTDDVAARAVGRPEVGHHPAPAEESPAALAEAAPYDASAEVLAESATAAPAAAESASAAPAVDTPEPVTHEPVASHEPMADAVPAWEPSAQPSVAREALAQEHEIALPEVDEDDIPLTWDPRPVPRPTYTMKARAAERPAPEPVPETGTVSATGADDGGERTAYDDGFETAPQRRVAGA
ncbi:hypothetical protein [Knoellia remsis]|uniref:hypothetical protein n=1 Tax=Knoellia remsis TaxID=407159 RepID=UPI000D0837E2|nr:hypothetical protein [Knoellia remsis]